MTTILWISGGILALSLGLLFGALGLYISKKFLYAAVGMANAEEFEDACDMMRSLVQTTDLYQTTYRDEARQYKEKAEKYSAELSALAQKLSLHADTAGIEEISERLESFRNACRKAQTAFDDYQKALAENEKYNSQEVLEKNREQYERMQKLERDLNFYNRQKTALFEKKRSLEEIFSTAVIHTERPMYIKTRLCDLKNTLEQYEKDAEALDIACDVLNDAVKVMKFRIKTLLSDMVNSTLKFALKEDECFILDDFYALQYKSGSRLVPIFGDNLSRSGRSPKGISRSLCEMAAIALRLALIELTETKISTAVFDEPFAFIDAYGEDKLIRKLSNSEIDQIFLFTSRKIDIDREKYNLIKL